jgi:cell division protein FtsW
MTVAHHLFARNDQSHLGQWWWRTDRWLLGAVVVLMALGAFLSFTSSPAAAARMHLGNQFYFAIRQSVFVLSGLSIFVGMSMLSAKDVKRAAFIIYLGALALMIALPFIGHEAKGATRWLHLGGFSLQPSEFMKPALVILAAWMFTESQKRQGVPGVSIAFGLWAISVVLLLTEKDFGQTVLITTTIFAMFFLIGVPLAWMAALFGLAASGAALVAFSSDHVRSRLEKFLSPEGSDTTQIDRASEAIAAGGLFGRGPGEGLMKRHVPDLHTDFIYSVAAEEYGLVFSLCLIGLFGFVVLTGLRRAMRLNDPFEQVAAAGLFMLLGQQAFINVAVNLNLIPTKGMTLPFISYGGSSMLAMGLTMGLALALVSRRPGAFSSSIQTGTEAQRSD